MCVSLSLWLVFWRGDRGGNSVDYDPPVAVTHPRPSLSYTAFSFNRTMLNAWLSRIITSAFHASTLSDLCTLVEMPCMYFQTAVRTGPGAAPPHFPRFDEISCRADRGFERRIITTPARSCLLFSAPVRITWSPYWAQALYSGPRLLALGCEGCRCVGTNENSCQRKKSKSSQTSPSFSCNHRFSYKGADQFFTHGSPIREACDIVRTSCILTSETQCM